MKGKGRSRLCRAFCSGVALALFLTLFGCGKRGDLVGSDGVGKGAPGNESGVASLTFSVSESPRGDRYICTLRETEDGAVFLYTSLLFTKDEEKSFPADGAVLSELTDLYRSLRIAEWDGFDKSDRSVLDGTDFTLSITFRDGKTLHAAGSNAFPQNFAAFRREMEEIARRYFPAE